MLAEARKKEEEREKSMKLGLPVDEEMEDGFNPFPDDPHHSLHDVGWKERSPRVAPALSHPKDVRNKHRPVADKNTFYISKEQSSRVSSGLLIATRRSVSIATLTEMMNTKLDINR